MLPDKNITILVVKKRAIFSCEREMMGMRMMKIGKMIVMGDHHQSSMIYQII